MRPARPSSLVESSQRRPRSCRALAAVVVLSLAGTAVGSAAEEAIFPDNFETGDPYRWSSFEPNATLTLTNYLSWCSVAIDDGAPSSAGSVTRAYLPGEVVSLTGAPLKGFVWGYWTGTDADQGSNDPNSQTTVTMTSDKSVLACCPFMSGMSCI